MTKVSVAICARTLDRWDELKRAVGSVSTRTRAPRDIVEIAAIEQARERNQRP
jgi:glucosyl-dolichyl phosphate glucuronosyltransferase